MGWDKISVQNFWGRNKLQNKKTKGDNFPLDINKTIYFFNQGEFEVRNKDFVGLRKNIYPCFSVILSTAIFVTKYILPYLSYLIDLDGCITK